MISFDDKTFINFKAKVFFPYMFKKKGMQALNLYCTILHATKIDDGLWEAIKCYGLMGSITLCIFLFRPEIYIYI